MQLRDSPEEAAFREEVRSWIADNLPEELRGRRGGAARFEELGREWSRKLGGAGYAATSWPKEYGGGGMPYSHQAILLEELARAQAPGHIGVIGLGMAGPTIIVHGTEEQKARYLPKILSAEEIWCQGFSEPGAGSDLAAVRTRAVRNGDHYVVNGQKVWSSFAHMADWCILVTREFDDQPRYQDLTYMLVDMHSPGVEARPLTQITGEAEFNEIFFTDVEVPVENVIAEPGMGWQVAMTTLMHERAALGFALSGAFEVAVTKLIELAKGRELDDRLRDLIAQSWIDLQALKWTNYRALTRLIETGAPGPEASIPKLHWSEANQRLGALALEILGPESQLMDDGFWQWLRLRSRGNTIEAGTSEILRNIVAERVLGLPKGR